MVIVTKRGQVANKPSVVRCSLKVHEASDWRTALLADLCKGRDGARLRRLVRAESNARRAERPLPRSNLGMLMLASHRTNAVGALLALCTVRHLAPVAVAKHEVRIRFALARVEEAMHPVKNPLRVDRLRIALEILDRQVSRATTFVALSPSHVPISAVA